jgi:hypothetical protein
MTFILVDPAQDECMVFKSRKGMSSWISAHYLDEDELAFWFYFKVPDDFCIPVRYLNNSCYVTGAISNMGYNSYRLTDDE